MNGKRGRLVKAGLYAILASGAGACGGGQALSESTPVPPPSRPAAEPTRQPATSGPSADDRSRREAEEARRELARKRATLEEMVFFDYDRSTIRDDAKRVLDAKLAILRAEPSIRLQIAGHADERGTAEYNLALGSRRANAVRDYLTGFGLATDRFEVTSYGEERPLARVSNEGAWSRNRRGEFVIRGGLGGLES